MTAWSRYDEKGLPSFLEDQMDLPHQWVRENPSRQKRERENMRMRELLLYHVPEIQ